ncbi:hypothetical protein [Aeromonas jandaei]|uniref:hypothetical protein n=1 Tax=Aeromonas jandaei TaxID=650 RepID=UPI002B05D304|nr:hypothetical protein [Aeromonas jandaei]
MDFVKIALFIAACPSFLTAAEVLPNCYKRAGIELPATNSTILLVDGNVQADFSGRKMAGKVLKEVEGGDMLVLASYRQGKVSIDLLGVVPSVAPEKLDHVEFPSEFSKNTYSRCVKKSNFEYPLKIRSALGKVMPFDSHSSYPGEDHLKILTSLLNQYVPSDAKGLTLYWFSDGSYNETQFNRIAAQLEYPEQVINSIESTGMGIPSMPKNSRVVMYSKTTYQPQKSGSPWQSYFDAIGIKFEQKSY